MDNMTAKVSCFARAYHHKNNEIYIFDDCLAESLLGSDYEKIADNMTNGLDFFFPDFAGTKEEGLRLIVDKQLAPSVLGRSAYCESKLASRKEQGCRQYVIFAAGYDTYSLSANTDEAFKVYELDLPEMLADKLERINKADLKSTAVYVPCDLSDTTWKDKLMQAGFDKSINSFGSLLGISYYIDREDFERLFANISDIMTEGSVICFDYPSVDESNETKTNRKLASAAGEQMKALYSYQDIILLLNKCGFEIMEHLNSDEMTEKYFEEYNAAVPEHCMQAPVGVAYVLAVKRSS